MCRVQWSVVSAVVVVIVIVASFIQSGDGLRCWKCDSPFDENCHDYFNVTKINQDLLRYKIDNEKELETQKITHLGNCDPNRLRYDSKYICLKTVTNRQVLNINGKSIVRRECRFVPLTFKEGDCPEDLKTNEIEFCDTCLSDGCNSANGLQPNIMLACLLPVIFSVLMKQ